jgi:two-component system chemotaxis sensor kinase CheA
LKYTFAADDLEILQGIVEESTEHLRGIEEGILRLEVDFASDLLDSIFRAMHSVKGVAGFLDLTPIKDTAHVLESFLTDMRKGLYTSNSEITDTLLRGVDILNGLIRQLGSQISRTEGDQDNAVLEIELNDLDYEAFIDEAEELRKKELTTAETNPDMTGGDSGADASIKVQLSPLYEQMLADFIEETLEHLETIEQKCVAAEKHPEDPEILNTILRGFHSIKGGAGVITSMQDSDNPADPIAAIRTLTHAAESLLQQHHNLSRQLSPAVVDVILAAVDKTTVLVAMLKGNKVEGFSLENLLERLDSLSQEKQGAGEKSPQEENHKKFPQQQAAFMNIGNQALESMLGIINSIKKGQTMNPKRTRQYIRALKSLASSAHYLNYEELLMAVDESLQSLDKYTPGKDKVTAELLQFLHSNYETVQRLINLKTENICLLLDNVPSEYSEKKIGEILISEKKVTPEQLDWALKQQKRLGDILVDAGTVKEDDLEIALTKQALAREKESQMIEQAKSSELGGQSIRVSQEKMDRLMNMIGELLISKNRVFHLAATIGLDYDMPALAREVKGVAAELARISDELQDAIMSARMIPLRVLFQRYPRTIRDTARKTGKQVDFIIEGEDTELDKTVIEAINDPLVHMLRNAVDHGIESPRERESKGKNPAGQVRLTAGYQGSYVLIEIIDDGKGLNPDEIKLKALKKGLLKAHQIENMSNEEAFQFIFAPGFSTREEVSELSGRGVGMDVVKTNIEKVGGSVSLSSKPDRGTRISLKIPLSMSIIRGLMVESYGQRFIIPLDAIEETVKLAGSSIRTYNSNMVADIREEIIPLVSLNAIMQFENDTDMVKECGTRETVPVVVITCDDCKFGLIVDRLQKEQEFVVKALAEELAGLKIYTGATIMGDGNVVLILNPSYLLQAQVAV